MSLQIITSTLPFSPQKSFFQMIEMSKSPKYISSDLRINRAENSDLSELELRVVIKATSVTKQVSHSEFLSYPRIIHFKMW